MEIIKHTSSIIASIFVVCFLSNAITLDNDMLTMIAILGYLVTTYFWENTDKYSNHKIEAEAKKQLAIDEKKRLIEAKKLQLLNSGK